MGQTLQIASEKNAYTITDRSTYLSRKATLQLDILNAGDPPLLNYYHVISVNRRSSQGPTAPVPTPSPTTS
jgi:tungstate transport system substrate-binding protein